MSESRIVLTAVGDVSLGDHPLCVGYGAHSRFKREDPLFPFEKIVDRLGETDLLFGNLECVISDHGARPGRLESIQMRGQPSYVEGLSRAGFKVMNFATNHSMQHGVDPFRSTLGLLQDHGIQHCGVNFQDHRRGVPTVIPVKGRRIAFVGYSLRPRQYFSEAPPYSEGNGPRICADLATFADSVDATVVSLHWGDEFIQEPSPEEIELARKVIDAGADVVIGHHPHVLRGIERYRRGVIAYSLGNFVCDMAWDRRLRETVVFSCTLGRDGVQDFGVLPVYVNDAYQPQPMTGPEAEELARHLESLSETLTKEDLSDLEEKSRDYGVRADQFQREYRALAHRYFLRNVTRCPPAVIVQQFLVYLTNRFSEAFSRKSVDLPSGSGNG
jgi:poly-gamma-glutamate synthesis protein (capsule biosynthesis protein)